MDQNKKTVEEQVLEMIRLKVKVADILRTVAAAADEAVTIAKAVRHFIYTEQIADGVIALSKFDDDLKELIENGEIEATRLIDGSIGKDKITTAFAEEIDGKATNTNLESLNTSISTRINGIDTTIAGIHATTDTLNYSITQMQQRINTIDSEIEDLPKEDDVESTISDKMVPLQTEIDKIPGLRLDINNLTAKVNTNKTNTDNALNLKANQSSVDSLVATLTELASKKADNTTLNSYTTKQLFDAFKSGLFSDLSDKVDGHEDSIDDILVEIAKKADISALSSYVTMTFFNAFKNGDFATLNSTVSSINGKTTALENASSSQGTSITNINNQISTINTKLDSKADSASIPSVSGLLTKSEFETFKSANTTIIGTKISSSDLNTALNNYVTSSELSSSLSSKADSNALSNYVTSSQLTTALTSKADINSISSTYATKNDVETLSDTIKSKDDVFVKISELDSKIQALGYTKKSYSSVE